jgi:hypothetical protein
VALEVAGSNPVIHPKLRKQWSDSVKGGRPVDPPPSSADRALSARSAAKTQCPLLWGTTTSSGSGVVFPELSLAVYRIE